jgi:hypothetical protein
MKRRIACAVVAVALAACGRGTVAEGKPPRKAGAPPPVATGPELQLVTPEHLPAVRRTPRFAATSASVAAAAATPGPATSFEGLGNGFTGPQGTFSVAFVPPDPSGAPGPDHYVQVVNVAYAVFDKTGTAVLGPRAFTAVWQSGNCFVSNEGPAAVLYDRAADRWILSHSALTTHLCVAVSQTPDPTGAYFGYEFILAEAVNYPTLALWPDGYYLTNPRSPGVRVCALNRAAMLGGQAASLVCLPAAEDSLIPADWDGRRPPPAGAPNPLVAFGATPSTLAVYRFHVDWAAPARSSLVGPTAVTVPSYADVCGGAGVNCIPQLGTTTKLDAVQDRLMYRLAYRNLGGHESLLVNHTVAANGGGGVRWYELEDPAAPTLRQVGTWAPDSGYRWMASLASDAVGNLALGYSRSSATMKPAIQYVTRAWDAPAGLLDGGEVLLHAGAGAQTTSSRWGLRSAMAVDPADDCTFWITNAYLPADGTFNWRTRVGAFRMPSCPPRLVATGPGVTAVGSPVTFGFTVQDQLGSTLSSYQASLPLDVSDKAAVAPATVDLVAGVGTATVTFGGAGTFTVTATDPFDAGRLTTTVKITVEAVGPVTTFQLEGLPAQPVAGVTYPVTVTARDAAGWLVVEYGGKGKVTTTDQRVSYEAPLDFAGGAAVLSAVFRTAGPQELAVADSQDGSILRTAKVAVVPAAASTLVLAGLPTSSAAGAVVDGTVTALDAFGNRARGHEGKANVTSTDGLAALPGTINLVAGAATVAATLRTAGAQGLTVTDDGNAALTVTGSIDVTPGDVAVLAVSGLPGTTVAGAALAGTVTATDAFGNVATSHAGTATVGVNDPQATAPASIGFVAGVASLPVTLRSAGSRTVSVADAVAGSVAVLATVEVTHAPAASYAITLAPSPVVGTASPVGLAARDAFGNAATSYAGTARLTSGDTRAILPGDLVFGGGSASGQITFGTAGSQTVTATDAGQPGVSGSAAVSVAAAPASSPGAEPASKGGCGCGGPVQPDVYVLLLGALALRLGRPRGAATRARR